MSDLKHLKLGELITLLESKGQTPIIGLAGSYVNSYRGYYDRLALEPGDGSFRADRFAESLRAQIGQIRTGYKGGDYTVHEGRFVYVDHYGEGKGMMLVGFTDSGYDLRPVLVEETW